MQKTLPECWPVDHASGPHIDSFTSLFWSQVWVLWRSCISRNSCTRLIKLGLVLTFLIDLTMILTMTAILKGNCYAWTMMIWKEPSKTCVFLILTISKTELHCDVTMTSKVALAFRRGLIVFTIVVFFLRCTSYLKAQVLCPTLNKAHKQFSDFLVLICCAGFFFSTTKLVLLCWFFCASPTRICKLHRFLLGSFS